jgi:hypothetical protein
MKKSLIALTILAGAALGAQASFFNETFNYPNGGIVSNSAGVWINNSGTAGSCLVSNQTLLVNTSWTEDIAHQFSPGYTNGAGTDNLYARLTVQWLTNSLPTVGGAYFFGFATTAINNYIARTWVNTTNLDGVTTAPAGSFYMGVGNNRPNSSSVWPIDGQLSTLFTTSVWYSVVVRHCLTNGLATIWVGTDPTTMTENGTASATAHDPPSTTSNIVNYVNFRQNTGEGYLQVKELKVGGSWNDVFFAPEISAISDQSIPRGGATPALAFTVSSSTVSASNLTVTTSSSNPTLVPNGSPNIVLAKDATYTNCTITVTPASTQQGSAVITVTVSDGTASSSTSFKVTVGAPVVAAIPNQITRIGTATPAIPFAVADSEGDAVTLTASSSNPTLVPSGNIVLGVAVTGVSSNVVVTPAPGQTGVTTISINASDSHNTNSMSFRLTVTPAPLGVVYSEDWAYPDGPLYLNSGGSGGPWYHVSGPAGEITVSNQLVWLVHTNNEDMGAAFIGGAIYQGTNGYVFYTSFTVDFSLTPSFSGDYFFHLSSSGTDTSNFRDRIFANAAGAPTNKFRLGIANQSTGVAAQNPRNLMLGATYAVISRFNAGTGDSTLWINPVSELSPGVTASDSPGSATIGGVALRQPGSLIGDLSIGPMKVGTSFSDVWTPPAQPVLQAAVDKSGNLVLGWTNAASISVVLQSAPNAAGSYTDIDATATAPHTSGSYSVRPTGQQYFRLRH